MRSRKYVAVIIVLLSAARPAWVWAEESSAGSPQSSLVAQGANGVKLSAGAMPVPVTTDAYSSAEASALDMTVAFAKGSLPLKALFPGKPMLVHFWATWCESCVRELPSLLGMMQDWRNRGVEVGIASPALEGKTPEQLAAYLGSVRAGGLRALTAELPEAMRLFRLRGLPTTVLFGADGRELWRGEGERDWATPAAQSEVLRAAGLDAGGKKR